MFDNFGVLQFVPFKFSKQNNEIQIVFFQEMPYFFEVRSNLVSLINIPIKIHQEIQVITKAFHELMENFQFVVTSTLIKRFRQSVIGKRIN